MTLQNRSSDRMMRPVHPVPKYIRDALRDQGLVAAYRSRPPYQQNDYIGWITRAKTETTQQKRLNQMLQELSGGTHYMKMVWKSNENI